MSMMTATIKVDPPRLERGEVLIVDEVPKEIIGVERLEHYVVYTAANLPAGATDVSMNVQNLRPEQTEIYQLENTGIDGAANVRLEFPSGSNRQTPHNIAEYWDQVSNPRVGYAVGLGKVYFFTVPDRYPTLRVTNPLAFAIAVTIYFFGWKYRVKQITAEEVEAKKALGIRVLEVESYYPTS